MYRGKNKQLCYVIFLPHRMPCWFGPLFSRLKRQTDLWPLQMHHNIELPVCLCCVVTPHNMLWVPSIPRVLCKLFADSNPFCSPKINATCCCWDIVTLHNRSALSHGKRGLSLVQHILSVFSWDITLLFPHINMSLTAFKQKSICHIMFKDDQQMAYAPLCVSTQLAVMFFSLIPWKHMISSISMTCLEGNKMKWCSWKKR